MPFEPGKSGNPEGRRSEDRRVKRLAKQHTEKAIEKLVHWLESDNPKASVTAACALLDRAYGKPKLTVDSTVTRRVVDVNNVARIRARITASLGSENAQGSSRGVEPVGRKRH